MGELQFTNGFERTETQDHRGWTSTRFSYGDDPGYTNPTDYRWYRDNSTSLR